MIISKLHLICEEEGRVAQERQRSAVLFVSERSCTERCRVDWWEMSSRLLGIRMSLSDFPSLVTFKDAAFRLISRWMLLVTQCRICFIWKDYLSDTEDTASTKGFVFFFFLFSPPKPLEKEIQWLYLICHTKRKFRITVCSIRTFFSPQSINHFLEHASSC